MATRAKPYSLAGSAEWGPASIQQLDAMLEELYQDLQITAAGGSHALLSATHTDVEVDDVARGALITGQQVGSSADAEWALLAIGTSGYFVKSDGVDATWGQVTEPDIVDGTLLARLAANETITGTWTFNADVILGAGVYLRQNSSSGVRLIGENGAGRILVGDAFNNNNSTVEFYVATIKKLDIAVSAIAASADILPNADSTYDLGSTTVAWAELHVDAIEFGLATDTTLTGSGGDLSVEGNLVYRAGGTDVPVADGGTGRSSHTAYAVLCGGTTTTTPQQSIASVGTAGQILTSNGAGLLPTFQAAATVDHGALTGLADDDHTQYALLVGRAGGQILIGGTAASDDLTLRSTSHATKGDLFLADEGGHVILGGGTTASELRFLEPSGSGTNYSAFKAQAQVASLTYTLPAAHGTDQFLKNDGSGGLSWATPTASAAGSDTQVQFNDGGTALGGDAGLTYDKTTDALTLAGQLIISGAAAGQVVFPATQNASANANTLDDYEEGTWTPVIGGSEGTSGQTYATQVGRYVKIGSLVIVTFHAQFSAKGTITGNVEIQGLPFTIENVTVQYWTAQIIWHTLATTWVNISAYLRPNTTTILVVGATAAATGNLGTNVVTGDLDDDSLFLGTAVFTATA